MAHSGEIGKVLQQARQSDRACFVQAFAEQVATEPFIPLYRGVQTPGGAAYGWPNRLLRYFWPTPVDTYPRTFEKLKQLALVGSQLSESIHGLRNWTAVEKATALTWANHIFVWGGVTNQAPFSADTVHAVMQNAIIDREDILNAPMNSGWTKVAAFATEHLEAVNGCAQVIWDSRVSWSVVTRLDELLASHGDCTRAELFPGIGRIPGRGGSRKVSIARKRLQLRWPNTYRTWRGQLAGSMFVRDLRDELNHRPDVFGQMPLPTGATQAWTVRGVEMVLFGDGY